MAEEAKNTESTGASSFGEIFKSLPLDDLKQNFTDYISAWSDKAIGGMGDKVSGLIENMGAGDGGSGAMGQAAQEGAQKLAEGESPVKAGLSGAATGAKEKVKETFGGGSGGSGGSGGGKFTSIIKTIDVGVPISVAYNQWTQFEDWTDFMKKVESVEQESEEKINFKGQVFWSHRTWNSTIIQQVADEQMVWRSTGEKGHLDGAVTFHEVAPRLTRIIAMVDYYPQGFMEKTGNIWRAVHRRVKVEMDRYIRQVMTSTILDPDSVEGWRGEIRDSEVVRSHEEVVEDEQAQQEQQDSDTDQSQDTESSAQDAQAEEEAPAEDEEAPAEEEAPADEESVEDEAAVEDEEPVADEAADDSAEAEEEAPAEDEEAPAEDEEAPAEEEEVPAEEEPTEDEEPVEDESADAEEAPAEDEEEAPAEDDEEAPAEEEVAPAEDEEASTEEEPTKNTGSKSKSSSSKRSSHSAKSGGGSKSTRSTSKRSSSSSKSGSGSKTTRSTSKQRQTKRS